MTEKLIDSMDENLETTKNESRPSEIGFLQIVAIKAFPMLASKHLDCFFSIKGCYPEGEEINETSLNTLNEIINDAEKLNMTRDINGLGQEAIYKS